MNSSGAARLLVAVALNDQPQTLEQLAERTGCHKLWVMAVLGDLIHAGLAKEAEEFAWVAHMPTDEELIRIQANQATKWLLQQVYGSAEPPSLGEGT